MSPEHTARLAVANDVTPPARRGSKRAPKGGWKFALAAKAVSL